MKCHYFKENTELYRVQLYSSLYRDGSHRKHILDFLFKFKNLSGIPSPLFSLWSKSHFPWVSSDLSLVFPNHFFVVHSLPHPPRFLHSYLFREHLNCILIRQYLFTATSLHLMVPSFPEGNLPRTYRSRVCERDREGTSMTKTTSQSSQEEIHSSVPPLPPALNSLTLRSSMSGLKASWHQTSNLTQESIF